MKCCFNHKKLKAAGKQCRAPPEVDPALGSWDCDFGDKRSGTYGGGVSCRLKCNDGYSPVGMDKNESTLEWCYQNKPFCCSILNATACEKDANGVRSCTTQRVNQVKRSDPKLA